MNWINDNQKAINDDQKITRLVLIKEKDKHSRKEKKQKGKRLKKDKERGGLKARW